MMNDRRAKVRHERLVRERTFHDARFGDETRQAADRYYAVDSGGARYAELIEPFGAPGEAVLEYGCGTGSAAFDLSRAGAHVVGIDISQTGVCEASDRARGEGLAARFLQMDAERLAFADRAFDKVCGSGILHHLDLDDALEELVRVLRPGGEAVFYEPLGTNPLINLYRRLTPSMRTPDEHPLLPVDFEKMRIPFAEVAVEHYNFVALAGAFLAKLPGGRRVVPTLHRVDAWLFRRFPASRRLAWVVVIRLRPRAS